MLTKGRLTAERVAAILERLIERQIVERSEAEIDQLAQAILREGAPTKSMAAGSGDARVVQ